VNYSRLGTFEHLGVFRAEFPGFLSRPKALNDRPLIVDCDVQFLWSTHIAKGD